METKHLWIFALVLTALVLVAGCIEEPVQTGTQAELVVEERETVTEATQPVEPETSTAAEESAEPAGTECGINDDCKDDDDCTTDSCNNGNCVHLVIAGCEVKETNSISIIGVSYNPDDEWVEVVGKNIDVRRWTIENNGTTRFTFDTSYFDFNGQIKIHTGYGMTTNSDRYMGQKGPWWVQGEPIYIKNTEGEVESQYP